LNSLQLFASFAVSGEYEIVGSGARHVL